MAERNYPYPIIFGLKDKARPNPGLNFKLEGRIQKMFGRNAYNLFLEEVKEGHNLTIGIFLQRFAEQNPNAAKGCCLREGHPCPMFVESIGPKGVKYTTPKGEPDTKFVKDFVTLSEGAPVWNRCPLVNKWLDLTETKAEKQFLEGYLKGYAGPKGLASLLPDELLMERVPKAACYNDFELGYKSVIDAWNEERARYFGSYVTLASLNRTLLACLWEPAFIPQVWINFIYDPKTGPSDPEKAHLVDRPTRVDFIMLESGKKHVIEIDGPEHYAKFQNNKWVISEEEYTKNLRIKRRLEWEGWQVHRFSNWEIEHAFNMEYFATVLDISPFFPEDVAPEQP